MKKTKFRECLIVIQYHPDVCVDDPYNRYDKVMEAYKEISFIQGEHKR